MREWSHSNIPSILRSHGLASIQLTSLVLSLTILQHGEESSPLSVALSSEFTSKSEAKKGLNEFFPSPLSDGI